MTAFKAIVADPPWSFGDMLPGKKRGAAKNYPCMNVAQIGGFDLPELDTDAVLFLWRVAAMQGEALDVVAMWGFQPKTEIVWYKQTKTGRPWFGMGRWTRAAHETCIVATRGKPVRLDASIRSVFTAQVGRHSEKPDEFFALVEKLCPGPYVELFARKARPGWTCYGNEINAEIP